MKKIAYMLPIAAAPGTALAHPGNHNHMTSFTQAVDHLMRSPFHAGLSVLALGATVYGIQALRKRQKARLSQKN